MTPRSLIEPARLAGSALLHTQTDERLVDLTRAGNDRAFEAIVGRYRRPLLRYCGGLLPPGRAEDAVQQAFLNAYRAIVEGEAELRLRPWLYRIAHNSALNLLRQNGWSYDQIPEDFDGVMQPPQAVEQSEHIRELVRAVKGLPERQRDAIVLRELEGRSYEEISVALGVSDGAVRQLLNRARTTLRSAATAITPSGLLERLADRAAMDAPGTARIAEVALGAGGAATLAKVGAAVVVAGAVAGGVAAGPLHAPGSVTGSGDAAAAQLAVSPATAGPGGARLLLDPNAAFAGLRPGRAGGNPASGGGGGALGGSSGSGIGVGAFALPGTSGPGGGSSGPGASSGPGGGDSGGGSGDGHSGSGSSGGGDSGSGHSGSGSSGGDSGSGHSGGGSSGGGDSGSGSSGSGSSGSGSSGSGDSGSGSSGSGSSGSGSSGSGSGSSGSGSGDGGSVSSGSGSSGSGSIDSGSGSSGRDSGSGERISSSGTG